MKPRLENDEPAIIRMQHAIFAGILILLGIILTLTILGAVIGIPMMLLGIVILVRHYA